MYRKHFSPNNLIFKNYLAYLTPDFQEAKTQPSHGLRDTRRLQTHFSDGISFEIPSYFLTLEVRGHQDNPSRLHQNEYHFLSFYDPLLLFCKQSQAGSGMNMFDNSSTWNECTTGTHYTIGSLIPDKGTRRVWSSAPAPHVSLLKAKLKNPGAENKGNISTLWCGLEGIKRGRR